MRKALAKRGLAGLRPESAVAGVGAAPPTPAHVRSESHPLYTFFRGMIEAQRCAALQLLSFTSEVIAERRSAGGAPAHTAPITSALARPWAARNPSLTYGALELLSLSVEDQVTVLSIYTEWKVEALSHAAVAASAEIRELSPTILPRGDELTVKRVRLALQGTLEAMSRAEVDPSLVSSELPATIAAMSLALREWVQERLKALQVDEEALLPWVVREFKHLDQTQRLASALVFGSMRPLRTVAEALLWALDNQPNARGRVRYKAALAGCLGFEAATEVLSLAERNRATAVGGFHHPTVAAAAAAGAPPPGSAARASSEHYGTLHENIIGPAAPSAYVPAIIGGVGTHARPPHSASDATGVGGHVAAQPLQLEGTAVPVPPRGRAMHDGASPPVSATTGLQESPPTRHHVRAVSEVTRAASGMPAATLAPVMREVAAAEGMPAPSATAAVTGGNGSGGARLQYFGAASVSSSERHVGESGSEEGANGGEESIYQDPGPCEDVCEVASYAVALPHVRRQQQLQPISARPSPPLQQLLDAHNGTPSPRVGMSARPNAPVPHSPRFGVLLRMGGPIVTGYSPAPSEASRGSLPAVAHRLSLRAPAAAEAPAGGSAAHGLADEDSDAMIAAAAKTWAGLTPRMSGIERVGGPGGGGGGPAGAGVLAHLSSVGTGDSWGSGGSGAAGLSWASAPTAPPGRPASAYRRRPLPDSFIFGPGGPPPPLPPQGAAGAADRSGGAPAKTRTEALPGGGAPGEGTPPVPVPSAAAVQSTGEGTGSGAVSSPPAAGADKGGQPSLALHTSPMRVRLPVPAHPPPAAPPAPEPRPLRVTWRQ